MLRAEYQEERRYGNKIIIFDRKLYKWTKSFNFDLITLIACDGNGRNVNCFWSEILNEEYDLIINYFYPRTWTVICLLCRRCSAIWFLVENLIWKITDNCWAGEGGRGASAWNWCPGQQRHTTMDGVSDVVGVRMESVRNDSRMIQDVDVLRSHEMGVESLSRYQMLLHHHHLYINNESFLHSFDQYFDQV